MIDTVMINEVIKIDMGQTVETGGQYRQDRGRPRYEQNYKGENFRGNERMYQNFERKNSRGEYRNNYRDEGYSRSRDRNRSGVRSFSRNFSNNRNNWCTSNSRPRSQSRESTNRQDQMLQV